MQIALQALGWKLWYWNPDTSSNELWDSVEKERSPTNSGHTWGSHAYNWKTVQTKGVYYKTRIDDAKSMVNFGTDVPAVLEKMPFVVGTAHMGYHVFAVIKGDVVEGHSTRRITDGQTLETSVFNPLADGGGPRGHYFSGVLAVPPGMAQ
jgi:hypothetical protein